MNNLDVLGKQSKQSGYDLLFKDIIVNSQKRNLERYPNPNNYSLNINSTFQRIQKAELIDVYIPSGTDITVNIPTNKNRLYFRYFFSGNTTYGYITIQPGTYLNPTSIATELTRQFKINLTYAGFDTSIKVDFSTNLNRYIIRDTQFTTPGTISIYPNNGYIVLPIGIKVTNSMSEILNLFTLSDELVSGPRYIKDSIAGLYPGDFTPGDYGSQSIEPPGYIPNNLDYLYSNCIMSNNILIDTKIYLSLGKLDGDTCNLIQDESGKNQTSPSIFCQVQNYNNTLNSSSITALLSKPGYYNSMQYYNPPVSKLNKFNIRWYQESGAPLDITEHSFTIRIHYYQKRLTRGPEFTY